MKKVAFFVEGQTEAVFIYNLLLNWFSCPHLKITWQRRVSWRTEELEAFDGGDAIYHFLILDCGGDEGVKSAILDRMPDLLGAGYSEIIGVRDLYPLELNELQRLKEGLAADLPNAPPIEFIVVCREIETWFIRERKHFLKLSDKLTTQAILDATGFHLENGDPLDIPHPAAFLHTVFQICGRKYRKREHEIRAIVESLDYGDFCMALPSKSHDIAQLMNALARVT
jgi:hypothetical protein